MAHPAELSFIYGTPSSVVYYLRHTWLGCLLFTAHLARLTINKRKEKNKLLQYQQPIFENVTVVTTMVIAIAFIALLYFILAIRSGRLVALLVSTILLLITGLFTYTQTKEPETKHLTDIPDLVQVQGTKVEIDRLPHNYTYTNNYNPTEKQIFIFKDNSLYTQNGEKVQITEDEYRLIKSKQTRKA